MSDDTERALTDARARLQNASPSHTIKPSDLLDLTHALTEAVSAAIPDIGVDVWDRAYDLQCKLQDTGDPAQSEFLVKIAQAHLRLSVAAGEPAVAALSALIELLQAAHNLDELNREARKRWNDALLFQSCATLDELFGGEA